MALQAVDPNLLTISVCLEPHCGQVISDSLPKSTNLEDELFSGGAMPYSLNFSKPCGLIQSVVQGGDNTVFISNSSIPAVNKAALISTSITVMAGHPL